MPGLDAASTVFFLVVREGRAFSPGSLGNYVPGTLPIWIATGGRFTTACIVSDAS
jgi:hypothetical protein